MGHSIRSISRSCLAAGAALAAAGSVAYAGELFPYNPPANAPQQRQQQRTPQPAARLSDEEMSKIDKLAKEIAKLKTAQKKKVRAGVQKELDEAVSRADMQQVRYYNELLRRIDNGR